MNCIPFGILAVQNIITQDRILKTTAAALNDLILIQACGQVMTATTMRMTFPLGGSAIDITALSLISTSDLGIELLYSTNLRIL